MLAGKSELVEAYEVLARMNDATPADHRLACLSAAVVTMLPPEMRTFA